MASSDQELVAPGHFQPKRLMEDLHEKIIASAKNFALIVDEHDLHGLLFQHIALCERRAWLHMNRINYAHLDERMSIGSVSHDLHKSRDHSVEGLIGISPDRIDWDRHKVIEAKGSAGAREAVSMQTRFYALMLSAATGVVWSAANEIIGKKKMLDVTMTLDDARRMIGLAEQICNLSEKEKAPEAQKKPICESCSYLQLCGFA